MRKKIFTIMTTQAFSISFVIFPFLVSCSMQPAYPEPPRTGNAVTVDVKTLQSEIPNFFTYRYQGKNINFFVVKINEKVLSFLDACMSCYAEKRGYRFDNGHIICGACNVRYSVSGIERGLGSCFPIRIAGRLQDGEYIIPLSALEGMADKF